MKRISVAFFLLTLSNSALAEWTSYGSLDGITFYADLTTINNNGNTAKLWVLYDFIEPKKDARGYFFSSMKTQVEYQCSSLNTRDIRIVAYSKNMANGAVLFDGKFDDNEYSRVTIPSFRSKIMIKACSRR